MVESRMIMALKKAIKDCSVVSVFSNRCAPDKCSVGLIERVTDKQVLIKHITEYGMYDGYIIRRLEDVFRVDISGQYEKRLYRLYKLHGQKHDNLLTNRIGKQYDLFREALIAAQREKYAVSINIDDTGEQDDITGWVRDISEEEASVSKITFDGDEDGESIFALSDIVKLNCDCEDERTYALLNTDHLTHKNL